MKKLILLVGALLINTCLHASQAISDGGESVEIKRDKDGYTATYQDGKKEYHPTGNNRSEVKEIYESQGVKVKTEGRKIQSVKTKKKSNER